MKIALVTGASSGMGCEFVRQIARDFLSLDEIWVVARRYDRLVALQEEITNVRLRLFACDVTSEATNEIKLALKKEKPTIKILVNCAGMGIIGSFIDLSEEDTINMVSLNCTSLTKMTKMCLPYMKNRSAIINLASSAAFLPQPSFATYAASKSYVLSLSYALSKELESRGIRVCAVCPGPVKTEFFDIAERYTKIKAYKSLLQSDPKKVVAKAIKDMRNNKKISVYGGTMKAFRVMCKILPHSFIIKFIK